MRLVCQCFRLYVVDSVYNTLLSEMLTDFFDAEQYSKFFRCRCSGRRSMLM